MSWRCVRFSDFLIFERCKVTKKSLIPQNFASFLTLATLKNRFFFIYTANEYASTVFLLHLI